MGRRTCHKARRWKLRTHCPGRTRGTAVDQPLAVFGERVLYLPLDALATEEHNIESRMKSGTGCDDDSNAHSEGTWNNIEKNTWEAPPQPIVIYSGASTSVLPRKWCLEVRAIETEASKHEEHYTAANGGRIYNKGDKVITKMSKEGYLRTMRLTSC